MYASVCVHFLFVNVGTLSPESASRRMVIRGTSASKTEDVSPFRRACIDGPGDRVPYLKEMSCVPVFLFRGVGAARGEVGCPKIRDSPELDSLKWRILLHTMDCPIVDSGT